MNAVTTYAPAAFMLIIGIMFLVTSWVIAELPCEKGHMLPWNYRLPILGSILGAIIIVVGVVSIIMKTNFKGSLADKTAHLISPLILIGLALWISLTMEYPYHKECFFANSKTNRIWPVLYVLNFLTVTLSGLVLAQHLV